MVIAMHMTHGEAERRVAVRLAVANAAAVERGLDREQALREQLATETARAMARGLEIERMAAQIGQLELLALKLQDELACERAAGVQLAGQVRELQEALDRSERQRVELEAVLDGAVGDVVVTRAELRDAFLDLADADTTEAEAVDAYTAAIDGPSVGGDETERLSRAMRAMRRRVTSRRTEAGMRERGAKLITWPEVSRG